jgi:serine/threonine protein kinase
VPEPVETAQMGGANEIWDVVGILLGEEEAPGSLVLDSRYVLEGHLPGVEPGGGGTVWQARDRLDVTRQRLVVKTVPTGTVNRGQLRALVREQRVAGVHNAHIGEILAHGDDRGFTYLVYPWYRPGSLGLYCKWDGSSRPLRWCADVIYEVLSGLMAAAAIGLVHLDIKPGNIVLDGQHARLIDWGLSRKWDASQPSTWVVRGSPFYACPEQLLAPEAGWDTPQADLYGVGATFYWLLTGEAPLQYEAGEAGAGFDLMAYRQLLKDRVHPQPVHELLPQVPQSLSVLIDRWLSLDPARRVSPETPAADIPRVARDELAALLRMLPDITVGRVRRRSR